MPRRRSLPFLFLAMLLGAAGAMPAVAQRDIDARGPRPGSIVPDFSVSSSTGRTETRASLSGPQGVVLVFIHSITWCPYCRSQLVELQSGYEALRSRGYGLAAIGSDAPDILREFAARHGITYVLLSDTGSAIIRRYGLLSGEFEPDDREYGSPHPSMLVVDRAGRVASNHFATAPGQRVTLGSLLARMGAAPEVTGTTVFADHLDVTPSSSARSVAPGQRFSLAVDVRPGPRIHVYAPENVDYIPIALRVSPHPRLAVYEAVYPESEEYLFVPLNERVQVYQKPFRIVQDVALVATPGTDSSVAPTAALEIAGELDYQACDDKLCFPPRTVPLRWRVEVAPLER